MPDKLKPYDQILEADAIILQILLDSLPYLRNELAHGNPMIYPGGLDLFAICADLINQLFEPS